MTKHERDTWRERFEAWRKASDELVARAFLIDNARREKGWALAESVGIPRHGGCLHNAACDERLTGWCKDNPERLRAARIANRWTQEYRATRIARRIAQETLPR